MSGWVAIPHAALAAAGRDGRVAVLELYERADRTGYAPRPFTERDLAEEWGTTRDGVRRILAALEAAGLVSLERSAPGTKRPSVLTVHPAVSNGNNQTRNQTRNQNDPRPAPTLEREQPDAEPDAEPSRAEESRAPETRLDQTRQTSVDRVKLSNARERASDAGAPEPGAGPTAPDPIAVAELVALQEASEEEGGEPQHGFANDRDRSALARALRRGVAASDLRALWAWSAVSDHPTVAGCRAGNWRRWGALLNGHHAEERIRAAVAWDRAGRPAPVARAGPGPPRRGESTAGDGVLAALREKFRKEAEHGDA